MTSTPPPLFDAGPGLTFFAAKHHKLFLSVTGKVATTGIVVKEIINRAQAEPAFAIAEPVINLLVENPKLCQALKTDEGSKEFMDALARLSSLPAAEALGMHRDLGEFTVLPHAIVQAQNGDDVTVIIDEKRGQQMALVENKRFSIAKMKGEKVGTIRLETTVSILQKAAEKKLITTASIWLGSTAI